MLVPFLLHVLIISQVAGVVLKAKEEDGRRQHQLRPPKFESNHCRPFFFFLLLRLFLASCVYVSCLACLVFLLFFLFFVDRACSDFGLEVA